MLRELQRDRGLAVLLLLVTGGLLFLVARDLGAGLPELPRVARSSGGPLRLPTREFEGLFASARVPGLAVPTNQMGGFYTTHFEPPAHPPPPKPTTRKVDVLYRGYFQAGEGPRHAVVLVGETQRVAGAGSLLLADLAVSEIGLRTLVLTNGAAGTNTLFFNVKTNLEVPTP